ncbi:TPA: hypothetical protein VEO38_001986 [Providencia alcalifaciens]|nr:hypothetical protein [Providencia alcalifaciens]
MYIPNLTYAGKGMSITYKDIVKARADLQEKYAKRQQLLQSCAQKLFASYRDSLSLENPQWKSSEGTTREYVSIGTVKNDGKFETCSPLSLRMNEDYSLNFALSTVLDDNPYTGGGYYIVNVSMKITNGALTLNLGGQVDLAILSFDSVESYLEASSIIKQIIMVGLNDEALD